MTDARKCKQCGIQLNEAHHRQAVYCSDQCKKDRIKKANRDYWRARYQAGKAIDGAIKQRKCTVCDAEIGADVHGLSKQCSRECRIKANNARTAAWRQRMLSGLQPPPETVLCKICDSPIPHRQGGGRSYCSRQCGVIGAKITNNPAAKRRFYDAKARGQTEFSLDDLKEKPRQIRTDCWRTFTPGSTIMPKKPFTGRIFGKTHKFGTILRFVVLEYTEDAMVCLYREQKCRVEVSRSEIDKFDMAFT